MLQRFIRFTAAALVLGSAVTLPARAADAKPAPAPAAMAAPAVAKPASAPMPAAAASAPDAATLDGRVQDIKSDVIKLNRDLLVLEEELLFPASTQVALFVSMDVGDRKSNV